MLIRLKDFMRTDRGWGTSQGREVHERLLEVVQAHPAVTVFAISLEDVLQMDTSFARESLILLARSFRGERGFCLIDACEEDILDNIDAVAHRQEQPVMVWTDNKPRLIGKQPSEGLRAMFDYVLANGNVTTHEAASYLNIGIPNASNKLKQLQEGGYLLRRERVAPSGGIEFEYYAIR